MNYESEYVAPVSSIHLEDEFGSLAKPAFLKISTISFSDILF
jgi:hypothetical protein